VAKITYEKTMTELPSKALSVLNNILDGCGIDQALITSTTRTPGHQADIMYENLELHGIAQQRKLYKPAGNAVIDVYDHLKAMGQTREWIISEMTKKIIELGPQNVSRHCVEPAVRSVFDVAPSSIPTEKHEEFSVALGLNPEVEKYFTPPIDPAFHIEIKL
jgi:hypothetical protein